MEIITSTKNQWVKTVKALYKRKGRKESGCFILEGWHLLEEALKAEAKIEQIFVLESQQERLQEVEGIPVYCVTESVLKAMSSAEKPQGVLAIARQWEYPELTLEGAWVFLDRVQDPGNVGTIIRTADAAGYQGVVLGEGCVDLYNDKVLRSMQGSQYHIPVYEKSLTEIISQFKAQSGKVYGTKLDRNAQDYRKVHPKGNYAILMGNEGKGVAKELLDQTDQNVFIPMRGQAESLNVAIATAILLFAWQ